MKQNRNMFSTLLNIKNANNVSNHNMDPKKTHQPRQLHIMEKQNDHTIREACGLSHDCLISKLEFQIF